MAKLKRKLKGVKANNNDKQKQQNESNQHCDVTTTQTSSSSSSTFSLGVHGVRLKHFEHVVAKLLTNNIEPHYVPLPKNVSLDDNIDLTSNNDSLFLFETYLPKSARVHGSHPGQINNEKRAIRKEGQLLSMLRCILPLVKYHVRSDTTTTTSTQPFTIVDFGGGSGHLALPLALLLPNCRVIVVDFNSKSISLLHEKAQKVIKNVITDDSESNIPLPTMAASKMTSSMKQNPLFRSCGSSEETILGNLFSFHGPVEQFTDEKFDIAIALHLCGQATDVTIRKAMEVKASAIVVAPCCVGKLSQKVYNPDIYNATGQNLATISYPQSTIFCQLIGNQRGTMDDDPSSTANSSDISQQQQNKDDWDALAKAGDYSNEQEINTSRNATRRIAKSLLEIDRQLYIEQTRAYKTKLLKMEPLDVTTKNDIIVAWKMDQYDDVVMQNLFSNPNKECQIDLEVTKSHLLNNSDHTVSTLNGEDTRGPTKHNDWTCEEEEEIKSTILQFLQQTENHIDFMNQVYTFPPKMGKRKRKLIHFVAGKIDLAHWSKGIKDSEKTVAIARRGQKSLKNLNKEHEIS